MEHDDMNIYELEEEELAFVMHNRGLCGSGCKFCEEDWWYRWSMEEYERGS